MALEKMLILITEMESELGLASATAKSANERLQVACMKGTTDEIEEARIRCVETYLAHVDMTIKWAKKIRDMRVSS